MEKQRQYTAGFRQGAAVGIGYLAVSFGFGIAAAAQGLDAWTALLISMTNLTSAGQVAGLSILTGGGGLLEMALTQFVINLRYALMSLSLSQKCADGYTTGHRLLTAFGITDEIFALAAARPEPLTPGYMAGVITLPFLGWSTGTFLGAVCGSLLPQSLCAALGVAIYGMFFAIFLPPVRESAAVAAVVCVSAGLSCLLRYVPLFAGISSGFSVILCALAASLLGAWLFPSEKRNRGTKKEEGGDAA